MRLSWLPGLALCIAASGCSESATEDPPELVARPTPTPYDPGAAPSVDPSLTTQQVGAFAATIPAYFASVDPKGMLAAYDNMLAAHGDESCPDIEVIEDDGGITSVWDGECESSDGTVFRGEMYYAQYTYDEGDTSEQQTSMYSFMLDITAEDGTFLRGAPQIEVGMTTSPEQTNYQMRFSGELVADEATAAGNPWLDGSLRGTVGAYAGEVEGGRFLGYSGGFIVPSDPSVTAVMISDLGIHSFGCDGIVGTVSLRDGVGAWHDAQFAPPFDDEPPPEQACNACGDLSFYGASLGEFCSDMPPFASVLAWETAPW